MTEFKTRRDPLLPSIPPENEWKTFSRVEQWRRSNLVVMRQLHSDVNIDLNTLANETANLEANQHAAVTVSDTSSINMTLTGQNIKADLDTDHRVSHVTLFPWEMTTLVGTWVIQINANQYLNGTWYNSTSANADSITSANLHMVSGTYRWTLLTRTGPDRGIAQITIDGVGASTYDLYSAGYVYNVAASNIVSIGTGIKTIGLKVYGKNASSSNYFLPFTYLNIHRYS